MYKAEQLALFEIEPEDSVAIYDTDSIPFLVVTSSTPTLTSALTMTASVTAETITKSSPPSE